MKRKKGDFRMAKIISISSFRGGTGKSTITSNIAVYLASLGNRVMILDTDIKSPGVHALFGLHEGIMKCTFNEYLTGNCDIEDSVYDVTDQMNLKQGNLFLTPSSITYHEIADTIVSKYSFDLLNDAFKKLIETYKLDYLIVDTHPGINEESLIAVEQADISLLIIRPDNQDYQGAKVSTEIAKRLGIKTNIIINKIHSKVDIKKMSKELEDIFEFPVVAAIPFSEDLLIAESKYVIYEKYPDHPFSKHIKNIVNEVIIIKPRKTLQQ